MTSMNRTKRRWLTAAVAVTGLALVAAGTAVANAATTPTPQLSFVVATNSVELTRYVYEGGSWIDGNLGTYLVAGKDPFEIRVTRKSYSDPIVANQVVVKNGKKTNVALPKGMVTDFSGLKAFSSITMKNAAGKTVVSETNDYCPNAYETIRTRPDAPDSSPYPQGCSYGNPFLIGNVWGIQAGWNAPIGLSQELDLPDGKYTTTVEIAKKYRDYFKIPADKASAKLTVTVKTVDESGSGAGLSASALTARSAAKKAAGVEAPGAAPGTDHTHVAQGDAKNQASAFSADLRPPTKRPATLANKAAAPKGPRPDLQSLPAWGISLVDGEKPDGTTDGHKYIAFGATVWNAGTSPLVVDGFRRTGTELMDAYQYFFDAKGKQVGSVNAGTMEWDSREGHVHWHFTDFAQYRLLKSDKKVAVKSGKEAFCLANTDAVDYTIPNAKWRPSNTDLSTSCGQNTAVAVRQVLDIGNGDTYGQYLPGQSFDVTNLANGTYYIEVLANPSNKLAETSTTNNSALRKVILSGSGANRKLEVPALYGLDGPAK
jgi:hypothetical protein